MHLDTATIQRIVGDVLKELGTPATAPRGVSTVHRQPSAVRIHEAVITAALLEERLDGRQAISIERRALLTPSAQDLIRERNVAVQRLASARKQTARLGTKFIVVTTHPSIDDLCAEAIRELAGSTDEAAKQSISAICRGEVDRVVVFTDRPHRAACLANRNDRIRAAVASDAGDVRSVAQEFSVNVWCVDPSSRSSFELAQLWKTIVSVPLTPDP